MYVVLLTMLLNLGQYRGVHRVLVVFESSTASHEQLVAAKDFQERDLIVIQGNDELRRKFDVAAGAFTVLLIGKDGGEKLRRKKPISVDELNATIDAMPMRQSEMKKH